MWTYRGTNWVQRTDGQRVWHAEARADGEGGFRVWFTTYTLASNLYRSTPVVEVPTIQSSNYVGAGPWMDVAEALEWAELRLREMAA